MNLFDADNVISSKSFEIQARGIAINISTASNNDMGTANSEDILVKESYGHD